MIMRIALVELPSRGGVAISVFAISASRGRRLARSGHIRIHPPVLDKPLQRGTLVHEVAHMVEGQATGWLIALLATMLLWAGAIAVEAWALLKKTPPRSSSGSRPT